MSGLLSASGVVSECGVVCESGGVSVSGVVSVPGVVSESGVVSMSGPSHGPHTYTCPSPGMQLKNESVRGAGYNSPKKGTHLKLKLDTRNPGDVTSYRIA